MIKVNILIIVTRKNFRWGKFSKYVFKDVFQYVLRLLRRPTAVSKY